MRASLFFHPALFACALCLSSSGASGGEERRLYVASLSYDVAIAPVDEQSANAEEAVLYTRRAAGDEWQRLGEGKRVVLPNGDVRFASAVDVEEDGVYEYTSRPVVGGSVMDAPAAKDAAQAVVVVDTLAPKVEIRQPAESAEVAPGGVLEISWAVADENLGEAPGVLTYSTDGGKSWALVERALPPEGSTKWIAPADMAGTAVVRLAAIDLAGNAGRDVRQLDAAAPEPAAASAPKTEEAPPVAAAPKDGAGGEDKAAAEEEPLLRDPNRSWLYYLMAVNLMRQNKPADALHYYWLSVKEDPEFVNAWADIALAYIDLGAYQTAREVVERARELAPERIDLLHLKGETFHAEGMAALGEARDSEERLRAKGFIDEAVAWYGQALEKAAAEWRIAEQAASFYRLGEVCYYVNMDREGARAYWEKILSLHTPPPNPDMVLWSPKNERAKEKKRQEHFTHARVALETWQKWARGYLEQMDARERAGIVDLMPAQRVASFGGDSLAYSGNEMNPGRGDGRSLFSLPAQLGSAENVAADVGYSNQAAMAAHMNEAPVVDGYSFYSDGSREGGASYQGGRRRARRRNSSAFSPILERAPEAPADPYAFPQGGRGTAPWNSSLPYGDKP